ncbi:MAG TPA: outer membrane lipoprotein-sorting protein, partial [Spirochaetia bacterium]|nr:outer membrane lipoprotein-sorting protein [Spirochaetia bacterium]
TTFTLVQKKPGETDRVLRVRTFRRDSADMYTIIFQYPDSEKGKGYLRRGDDLYFYLPSTREFVYRNRKDNIGSTDARTDLFGRQKILEQYTASLAGTATVSKWECDVVRLDARVQDVSYPVQKWYVRRTDGLPVKVENFSLSETLLATFYYVEYKALGNGKSVFTKLLAVNNLEKGQQTFLTNDAISTSAIPDYTFTKPYLEEQSR